VKLEVSHDALVYQIDSNDSGARQFGNMGEEIIKNCRYIEYDTFKQILEMDDDEIDRDFSKEIVVAFFTQAESTIKKIKQGMYELSIPACEVLNTPTNIYIL